MSYRRFVRDLQRWLAAFPWRTQKKAYSRRRLALIISLVADRLQMVRVSPMADPGLLPLLEVTGSLVRGCLDAARGVLAMADLREYGGIVAAERSAWEMWNELDFLLRSDDPPKEAVKVQVNGTLEILDVISDGTVPAPEGMAERNSDALAEFERKYPEIVATVREQRKKRRFHWSGLSRTAVVAPGDTERLVYKMLSWETHPDVLATRDISAEIQNGDAVLTLSVGADPNSLVERSASSTSECLLRSWNLFARFWMLDELTDVAPRKSG